MENYYYYYCFKLIQSIIYNIDKDDKSDLDCYFQNVSFLEDFKATILAAYKNNSIDEDVKFSLFNKMMYIRDINDENRDKRINIINEIIYTLNSFSQNRTSNFYFTEYWKRNYGRYNLKKIIVEIEQLKNLILESICYDIQVLYTHSNKVSDNEFLDLVPLFKEDDIYFLSISAMFYEMPELFKDELFYKRFKLICSNYQMDKDDKKLVKKIDKYAKNV